MQALRTDLGVCFNVWTSHRTWFWSLIYPDRQGGVIGAATSEAEAVREARAAIEQLPQRRYTTGVVLVRCEDSEVARRCQGSKNSQFHTGREKWAGGGESAFTSAAQKQRAKMPECGASCSNLWQLTLQQYAARVANV